MAQTNEEVFREYQFKFSTPGARANGFGGAFIGLADDATASFTNPAGLAYLRETSFTAEFRNKTIDAQIVEADRGSVSFGFEQEERSLEGLSFASLSHRFGKLYLGFYQYTFLDEHQERSFASRSLQDGVLAIDVQDVLLDLEGKMWGLSAAGRFGDWKLGLSANMMTYRGFTRYELVHQEILPEIKTSRFVSTIDDQDRGWGINLGALYQPSEQFSVGLVWRNNPKFALTEDVTEVVLGLEVLRDQLEVPFVVPDVHGVGARYRVTNAISLLADWQWIRYSQIIEDGFVIVEANDTETRANYQSSDVQEFHFGGEYLWATRYGIFAFRAGFFRNPIHAIEYTGEDELIRDRFAGSGFSDENHKTIGLGWVFKNRFELDFSADFWERGREYTLSVIWRKK